MPRTQRSPKKPDAFLLYYEDRRQSIKHELENELERSAKGTEVKKRARERFKELLGPEKQKYSKQYQKALKEYNTAVENFKANGGVMFVPKRRGSDKATGKRQRKEAEVGEGTRAWKEKDFDGSKTKNIPFLKTEDERIVEAAKQVAADRNQNESEFLDYLKDERVSGKTWVTVATLAGVQTRSVQALSKRLRRMMNGGHHWTKQELQELIDAVADQGPRWKNIGTGLSISAEKCRDKWVHAICGGGAKGEWTSEEKWALRQGIVEATDQLVPINNIPWIQVSKWVPHRTHAQCLEHWYHKMQPRLLQYQDKYKRPIEPDVIRRQMVRKLRKMIDADEVDDEHDVLWEKVNGMWPAWMNKEEVVRRLYPRLPHQLQKNFCDGDADHENFPERIAWLFENLECGRHKKMDRRFLKHAKLVIDAEAEEQEDETEEDDDA